MDAKWARALNKISKLWEWKNTKKRGSVILASMCENESGSFAHVDSTNRSYRILNRTSEVRNLNSMTLWIGTTSHIPRFHCFVFDFNKFVIILLHFVQISQNHKIVKHKKFGLFISQTLWGEASGGDHLAIWRQMTLTSVVSCKSFRRYFLQHQCKIFCIVFEMMNWKRGLLWTNHGLQLLIL